MQEGGCNLQLEKKKRWAVPDASELPHKRPDATGSACHHLSPEIQRQAGRERECNDVVKGAATPFTCR